MNKSNLPFFFFPQVTVLCAMGEEAAISIKAMANKQATAGKMFAQTQLSVAKFQSLCTFGFVSVSLSFVFQD